MSIGACVGFKEALAANRLAGGNTDHYPMNPFVGQNFFEDENYRAALERLDGGESTPPLVIDLFLSSSRLLFRAGYVIATDLI